MCLSLIVTNNDDAVDSDRKVCCPKSLETRHAGEGKP